MAGFPVNFEKNIKCSNCSMATNYELAVCRHCGFKFENEELLRLREELDEKERKQMVFGALGAIGVLIILFFIFSFLSKK